MAWNQADETLIAGTGEVYIAPVGTTLPANADSSLNSAFYGLGYHTEEGVAINKTLEIIEFRAWQSRFPIRRERDTEDLTLTFTLLQWNEETIPFAMGGGSIDSLGGDQYKYTPAADAEALAEKSLVCDVEDGDRKMRFVIPRGSVSEGAEAQFQRTEMAGLAVSFKSLEPEDTGDPWYILLNDAAAMAAGS